MASFLDNLEILSSLTQEDRDSLSAFCQERFLKKGETIFNEGEEGNAMYFLKSGKIDIYKNINGENVKIGTVFAEGILGEMALFQDKNNKRGATGIAVEDSVLVVILGFSIDELKNKHSDIIAKIINIIEFRNYQNAKFYI